MAQSIKKVQDIRRAMSLDKTADMSSIIANVLSVVGSVGAFLGIFSGFGTTIINLPGSMSFDGFGFPVLLVLFAIASIALGWALGAILTFLTARKQEHWIISAYFISMLWAGVLVALSETLTSSIRNEFLPLVPLFCLLGSGIVMWILSFRFRSKTVSRTAHTLRSRATCIFIFSFSVLIVLFLNELRSI